MVRFRIFVKRKFIVDFSAFYPDESPCVRCRGHCLSENNRERENRIDFSAKMCYIVFKSGGTASAVEKVKPDPLNLSVKTGAGKLFNAAKC